MLWGTDKSEQSKSIELKRFIIIIGWLTSCRKRQVNSSAAIIMCGRDENCSYIQKMENGATENIIFLPFY